MPRRAVVALFSGAFGQPSGHMTLRLSLLAVAVTLSWESKLAHDDVRPISQLAHGAAAGDTGEALEHSWAAY